jgi:hypothetical protein
VLSSSAARGLRSAPLSSFNGHNDSLDRGLCNSCDMDKNCNSVAVVRSWCALSLMRRGIV